MTPCEVTAWRHGTIWHLWARKLTRRARCGRPVNAQAFFYLGQWYWLNLNSLILMLYLIFGMSQNLTTLKFIKAECRRGCQFHYRVSKVRWNTLAIEQTHQIFIILWLLNVTKLITEHILWWMCNFPSQEKLETLRRKYTFEKYKWYSIKKYYRASVRWGLHWIHHGHFGMGPI